MYRGVVRVGKTVHSKSKQILLEEREKDIYFYFFFFLLSWLIHFSDLCWKFYRIFPWFCKYGPIKEIWTPLLLTWGPLNASGTPECFWKTFQLRVLNSTQHICCSFPIFLKAFMCIQMLCLLRIHLHLWLIHCWIWLLCLLHHSCYGNNYKVINSTKQRFESEFHEIFPGFYKSASFSQGWLILFLVNPYSPKLHIFNTI